MSVEPYSIRFHLAILFSFFSLTLIERKSDP